MARDRVFDFLQVHRFWLLDIMPSAAYPFYVLGSPLLGFESIASPEYTFETENLKELNSMFKKTVYQGGELGPMTLTRGVLGYDSSFWEWVQKAVRGYDFPNRDMLLVHFMQIGGDPQLPFPFEAWEGAAKVPGKAWLLWDVIPTRYKMASDFDAKSGEVSIAELEVQPFAIEEFCLLDAT